MTKKTRLALLAIPAFAAASAQAAAVDVSSVVADIGDQVGSVTNIGMAILGVVVAIACFMWIRRSIK